VGVGGSSGWGKSVFLQCLAIQIALAPELAQLALIDIEGQTFSPFAALGRERLRYPLADNEPDIIAILDDLKGEWKRRRQLFQRYPSAADLDSYNALAEDKLPPVVMMFDEINMVTDDKDIMGRLTRLGQGTRKYGVFCILGGQDWNAVSIPTKLRNNFSTRIQLKAMSKTQSRVMLEDSAAADIQDPGRAYVVLPGRGLAEIQTPYISKADIISTLSGRCGISPTMPVPISVIKSEPDQEESKVIAAYEKLRDGPVKFSWNAVVRAAYGDNKTGKFYHDKLKGTLDKFEIDY
jgi:DNA segregation ATPase FtsK/SpoIIIE-like protein